MPAELSIDPQRLWSALMASAAIGATEHGGLCRLALTEADREMRDVFAGWAREAGYALTIDRLGNMFVRRDGTDPALPPVLIGSHLDTQARGGRFDGVLGVLAGIEVLRTLDACAIATKRAVEVVNWTNEEGARFQPAMLASLAFVGEQSVEWVYDRRDRDGIRFGDALAAIDYCGQAPVGGRT